MRGSRSLLLLLVALAFSAPFAHADAELELRIALGYRPTTPGTDVPGLLGNWVSGCASIDGKHHARLEMEYTPTQMRGRSTSYGDSKCETSPQLSTWTVSDYMIVGLSPGSKNIYRIVANFREISFAAHSEAAVKFLNKANFCEMHDWTAVDVSSPGRQAPCYGSETQLEGNQTFDIIRIDRNGTLQVGRVESPVQVDKLTTWPEKLSDKLVFRKVKAVPVSLD